MKFQVAAVSYLFELAAFINVDLRIISVTFKVYYILIKMVQLPRKYCN